MAVQNSLQPKKSKPTFQAFIKNDIVSNNIYKTLGSQTKGKKFIASIISAVNNNPELQNCDFSTTVSAGLTGEALNLSPSPQLGHYYMVPFNDKKNNRKVTTFQLGYKGYIQLAIRSGQYKRINVVDVKEGELISYNPFDEEIKVRPIEDEREREKANTVGYYAMFELVNGFKKTMFWSKEKMVHHADKYSPAFSAEESEVKTRTGVFKKVSFVDYQAGNYDQNTSWLYSSFWYKDFDGMAFKTMLRQLISKWGIMSIEMQTAFDNDMAFKNDVEDIPNHEAMDTVEVDIVETEIESDTGNTEETPNGSRGVNLF